MKYILFFLSFWTLASFDMHASEPPDIPEAYKHVDQVLWVVADVNHTMEQYRKLGFSQFRNFGEVEVVSGTSGDKWKIKLVCANLGGAHVNWIQPLEGNSIFKKFLDKSGDGAISLVHRFPARENVREEIGRLWDLNVKFLEKVTIRTEKGEMIFALLDTYEAGKYYLGFTYGESGSAIHQSLGIENRNKLVLNQYAFAIRDPEPVSEYWKTIGLPGLAISHPDLGSPKYYGEPTDHELIQGWQRHGTIAYEWCIPVKPPIVYDDHIQKHGEGIHHLAFSVKEMDAVLEDFTSRGFVVSMGGTWGEVGKPGSGRYEYIDLEKAGGTTMELLWNYKE
jgi:hypothetical protein